MEDTSDRLFKILRRSAFIEVYREWMAAESHAERGILEYHGWIWNDFVAEYKTYNEHELYQQLGR